MVLPLILGLPHAVAGGILCGQRISQNLGKPVGSIVPLADAVAAHEMLAGTRPHQRGKIVIDLNPC